MKELGLEDIPDRLVLGNAYNARKPGYEKALSGIVSLVGAALRKAGIRLTVKGRVKDFDSLYEKRLRLLRKARNEGADPLAVNDTLAVRAVCPFLGDLVIAEKALCAAFDVVEIERKGSERSFREFGYESIHVLARVPEAFRTLCEGLDRDVFEIQLRTILQEAWAEVEHELVYKAEFTPFDEPMKRKLAALNANLTLSDIIFQEILEYQKKLNGELSKRRSAFYEKIEDVADSPESPPAGLPGKPEETDAYGKSGSAAAGEAPAIAGFVYLDAAINPGSKVSCQYPVSEEDMDRLLLEALEAHNREDYDRAVHFYGQIIGQSPGSAAAAVVYKHRGMAYFAQSRYRQAEQDFTSCLELDPSCYKAAYYRGVVKSVLQDHPGAVADFTRALDIHPYHFFSRYRRALAWWRLGDAAQALSDCEIALHVQPGNNLVTGLRDSIRAELHGDEF